MFMFPDWLIYIFAVFGFMCAWCISAAAVGVWLGFLLHKIDQ